MTRFFNSNTPSNKPVNLAVLLFSQLLPVMVVCGLFFVHEYSEKPTFKQRISELNSKHLQAIEERLKQAKPSGALLKGDRKTAESFLRILSKAASWQVKETKMYPRIVENQIMPIDFRVKLVGDPYDLPVLLNGLHRQRPLCRIDEINMQMMEDKKAYLSMQIRYFRPAIPSDEWLTKLELDSAQRIILLRGWEMWSWETYLRSEQGLRKEVEQRQKSLQEGLPSALIQMKEKGGKLSWSPIGGVKYNP